MDQHTKSYWVAVDFASFRIDVEDGVVVFAAPIARWMEGKHVNDIRGWFKKHRAKVVELNDSKVDLVDRLVTGKGEEVCPTCGRSKPAGGMYRDEPKTCKPCRDGS